ncbi:Protein N-acetyltransferase, RimJ/RimL family [Lachnospiraceae bacterium]|nr:Protein N-acetyltransferase, RimJ/RimL family [Lachnospiraceae bacterium]
MIIDGERIYLTTITYDDCEDFVRWRNSSFIKSKFIYRKDITVDEQIRWIKTQVETGNVIQFIIWDKNDKKKIGSVYLQHIDSENGKCEFGILIGEEEYLGLGYGTEANDLICHYAFEKVGMKKIYLRVLNDNIGAMKSYKKAGFEVDDNIRKELMEDSSQDNVVFMSKYRGNQ